MLTINENDNKCIEKFIFQQPKVNESKCHEGFWNNVLDGLQDSILIFSEFGELIHANSNAYNIYRMGKSENAKILLDFIRSLCKSLIEYSLYENKLVISDEIVLNSSEVFRVRVRWLDMNKYDFRYLLVTIENRYESIKNVAIAEAKKFELTQRETEIWCLYRANSTYKQISEKLYISLNTVKKHMKNIHAKRQWQRM
ncbi:LuxR family transcriptional regulator [Calothrix sp. NIES-4071]|nr:LuxR family transcriptional regulator [Calothrix sp. NIES-4071]BAZ60906.1 LuxR family transcriptional regulator [Calothrix sp. NIES-4105]